MLTYEDAEELTMLDRDAEGPTAEDIAWYCREILPRDLDQATAEDWADWLELTYDPDM